jgi:hypothetical protein
MGDFHGRRVDGLAVDAVHHGPQQRVGGQHEQRADGRLHDQVRPGARADRRRAPQRGRRVEAAHIAFLAHDHAGAQETDAGHHVGHHAHRAIVAGEMVGHIDEDRRAHGHQHIGAQPGRALAVLALVADHAAEHERGGEADRRIEQRLRIDVLQRFQGHDRGLRGQASRDCVTGL